jgi:hypothetical protein
LPELSKIKSLRTTVSRKWPKINAYSKGARWLMSESTEKASEKLFIFRNSKVTVMTDIEAQNCEKYVLTSPDI